MTQLTALSASVYGGILGGLLYSVFALLHRAVSGRFLHAALDACFYMLLTALFSLTLLYINGGEVRVYLIAGFALGVFSGARAVKSIVRLLINKK